MTAEDRYGDMCCVGATAICNHGAGHACRDCHVQALAVIAALEHAYDLIVSRKVQP